MAAGSLKKLRHAPWSFWLVPVLGLVLVGSVLYMASVMRTSGKNSEVGDPVYAEHPIPVSGEFLQAVRGAKAEMPARPSANAQQLFASERRVAAVGSGYPIPYHAKTCPFSGILQPELSQMDRDGDGITDDWELTFGLDRSAKQDAAEDFDQDGFTNLEEFASGTNPRDASSHPLYVHKLRFVAQKIMTFPLVFQGYTELADGSTVFQLNEVDSGKSYFASLNDSVEGVVIQRFVEGEIGDDPRLYVRRGRCEIELIRGKTVPDPEKQAELINILDRTSIIVTMDALLSLHSDEYAVLGVHPDKVVVRHLGTGEVFDIVGLADGER